MSKECKSQLNENRRQRTKIAPKNNQLLPSRKFSDHYLIAANKCKTNILILIFNPKP